MSGYHALKTHISEKKQNGEKMIMENKAIKDELTLTGVTPSAEE